MPRIKSKTSVHTETQQDEKTPKLNKNRRIDETIRLRKPACWSYQLIFSIRPFYLLANINFFSLNMQIEQVILFLACICVYSPGWWAQEFVYDDQEAIVNNPVVTGKKHWSEVFWRDYWGHPIHLASSHKSYRPVTTLTFMLEHALFGLQSWRYRLTNVLLHAIVTLQIYKFMSRLSFIFEKEQKEHKYSNLTKNGLGTSKQFLAALVFALHPIHSEAVCNIVGRAELLMTLFFLVSFDQFLSIKYSTNKPLLQPRYFFYLVLVVLSMFSKEQGIMILPICIVFDWLSPLCSYANKKATASRTVVQLCLLFILLTLRIYINNFSKPVFSKEENPAAFLPTRHMRMLNYLYIWMLNLWLLIKPNKLSFDYSSGCIPIISTLFERRSFLCFFAAFFFILAFITCSCWLQWSKPKHRLFTFLISFGLLAFLPSSNLLVTVGFTLAERVLYLPSFPFIWLVFDLIQEFIELICFILLSAQKDLRKRLCDAVKNAYTIVFTTIIFLAASKTFERTNEWNSELLLYSSGLAVCSNNPKIYYNIGKVLSNLGQTHKAQRNYLSTLKLNPDHELALNNLALILEKRGQLEVAEALLKKALSIRPRFSIAWMNLGIVQMGRTNYLDSEKSFLKALEIRKDYAECLFNLGNLYLKTNRTLEAQECWVTVTNIDPEHMPAWSNLFLLLERREDCSTVNFLSEKALKWNPQSAVLQSLIGICLTKIADSSKFFDNHINKKAESFFLKSVEIEPQNFLYWNNLGVFYHKLKNFTQAQKSYEKALELKPLNEVVRINLLRLTNQIGV